jgi:CcmD family protein
MRILILVAVILALLLAGVPEAVAAQTGLADPQALASQSLRGYTHMFIAYFIAWAIIFGWVVSIGRRLARLEKRLRK